MRDFLEATPIWLPGVIAMLPLLAGSALASAGETALFFLSNDEIRAFRVGRTPERAVASLLNDPDRVLTGVLFLNLAVNLIYFAVSVVVSQRLLAAKMPGAAGIFGFVSFLCVLLAAEVIPKILAAVFRRRLAPLLVWPIALVLRILDPLMPLFGNLTMLARRTFWPDVKAEAMLNAEDLENAVNVSELSAEAIRQEKQILHNILDLSEITVEEMMRPRGTYLAHKAPLPVAAIAGKHPLPDYIAIVGEDQQDVDAVVALDDFSTTPPPQLEQAAGEVVHVPWCATAAGALTLIRDRAVSVASVVNEYGETIGIVTYDDLIDAVLIPESHRALRFLPHDAVLEVAPDRYHVEGITPLRHLCGRLGIEYDPDSDELVTLAGMLHEKLERIPAVGDEVLWNAFRVRVIEVSKRGRLRAMLTAEPVPAGSDDEEPEE